MLERHGRISELMLYNHYIHQLFYSKYWLQATIDTTESHEGKSQNACCHKSYRHSTHSLWDVSHSEMFAQACKYYECQAKAYSRSNSIHETCNHAVLRGLLHPVWHSLW